jgi:hypothetical protein
MVNAMETLRRTGRSVRVAVTVVAALTLLAGTLWGSDDDFPFGPFSMYAGVNAPNDPAPDTRVEGTDTTGTTLLLNENNAGVRRAEIEGEEASYIANPNLLASIADAYARLNPTAPRIVKVALIVRLYEIHNDRITGAWRDDVRATWTGVP